MMRLKIPIHRSARRYRPKFAHVSAQELFCFRRLQPVRLALHRPLFAKKRQRNNGYVVTELSTLNFICGGRSRRTAIANTRAKLARKGMDAWKLLTLVRRHKKYHRSRQGRKEFACV